MARIFDEWQTEQDRELLCSELMEKYELYAKKLFINYEPLLISNTESVPRDFFQRLDRWLKNFPNDTDQWDAFQLINDIFYVGRHELIELYRVAFEVIVPNWICDIHKFNFRSKDYYPNLQLAMKQTWFCPITDSLRISAFRHINHIEEPDFFPDWRSLSVFGDEAAIKKYILDKKFKQVVLIEDFVGSGKQITPALKLAERICGVPVLVMPLVIGAKGNSNISKFANDSEGKIHFRPVVVLGEDCMVTKAAPEGREHASSLRARNLIDSYCRSTGDNSGYGFEESQGYLFVAETNCPNNTIRPIHSGNKWSPLFPRSGRRSKK
jgi:hypothetical protein